MDTKYKQMEVVPLPDNGGGEKKALFASEVVVILNRLLKLYLI